MQTRRVVVVLAMLLAASATAHAADEPIVVYEGKLQDGKRRPVGGIFPLTFAFHRTSRGGKAVWSEAHFVAVDAGKYVVELGSKRPIPPSLDLDQLFLSVSLSGGDEIVREKVDPKTVRRGEAIAAVAPAAEAPGAPGAAGRKGVVDYAETAGLAYEAEHAKVADRLGTLTLEELEQRLEKSGGKASIGTAKRYTASAGGEGGAAYEIKCPKGFVVTGVRGGSGIYLDSIQLICSPLE